MPKNFFETCHGRGKCRKIFLRLAVSVANSNYFKLAIRNKQDIAVLIFPSVSLREIHSVKLRVVKIIKHRVSQSGFHGGTRSGLLHVIYFLFLSGRP